MVVRRLDHAGDSSLAFFSQVRAAAGTPPRVLLGGRTTTGTTAFVVFVVLRFPTTSLSATAADTAPLTVLLEAAADATAEISTGLFPAGKLGVTLPT